MREGPTAAAAGRRVESTIPAPCRFHRRADAARAAEPSGEPRVVPTTSAALARTAATATPRWRRAPLPPIRRP